MAWDGGEASRSGRWALLLGDVTVLGNVKRLRRRADWRHRLGHAFAAAAAAAFIFTGGHGSGLVVQSAEVDWPWVAICGADGITFYNTDTGERRRPAGGGSGPAACHIGVRRESDGLADAIV